MAFKTRITRSPLPADPERANAILQALPDDLTTGSVGTLLFGVAGSSPYLARLIERHAQALPDLLAESPESKIEQIRETLKDAIAIETAQAEVARHLRQAKSKVALLIALADLGGVWDLTMVTRSLTEFADSACEVAARWLLNRDVTAGRLPENGFVLLAMGKMGAGELNYSSDIDLIALFDDEQFDGTDVVDAKSAYIKVTRNLVKLLSENTADGYVFSTDLRLRPSPSTTPVCMAMSAAERYYESVGRTWERAAHIKARPLCDRVAGQTYLQALTPFIWRRHLDFAAIDDIHDMLRKIREKRAQFTVGALPGHDLKLGPGGIREIEFFAQTRQLIMGGRNPALRAPATLDALAALAKADVITEATRASLDGDYRSLRTVEHRLQMMEDAQTHSVPTSREARVRLAKLCGQDDRAAFEQELSALLARVNANTGEFFGVQTTGSRTGRYLDEDSLIEMGFERPGDAARQIARWHTGQIAATRAERARTLYLGLENQIIRGLSGAASPDQALVEFDRFLSGLPAGVQVFSLFTANPKLLDLIIAICAAAPRLAAYLGRRSRTLDALLDRDFWEPLPDTEELLRSLNERLDPETDYESVLDAVRRWSREMQFRVGVQVLRGLADAREAGRAFTHIAEACIRGLLPHVARDFGLRHGPMPGLGLAVIAMGKLGSSDMTAASDLDLIIVYDPDQVEASDGPRPLASRVYYTRLTQALVASLTAATAEGVLYEVDMRLRPSGRQGPVAVSIGAFESYQLNEAWVWEHLALTRARLIAGPPVLISRLDEIITKALKNREKTEHVIDQAREMRSRLAVTNAASRERLWALKLGAGGLMDIEFLAQTGALFHGLRTTFPVPETLAALRDVGWLSGAHANELDACFRLSALLQQIERVALDAPIDPETAGVELCRVLVQATGRSDFQDLQQHLRDLRDAAAFACDAQLPPIQTPEQ